MGNIFSRFRKKKTTIEVLDVLEKKIKDIEQYGQTTEQNHKRVVGLLVVYSVALYVFTATVFYFYFFPAKFYDQIFYMTPLLLFPVLILSVKKIVSWFYRRKLSKNHEKLLSLQEEKKKILDEVTENETYKKAKEILLKFAPDQLKVTPITQRQSQVFSDTSKLDTPDSITKLKQPETELRHRNLIVSNLSQSSNKERLSDSAFLLPSLDTSSRKSETPLPRPILPRQRSYIDKLVEYVVGDGPSNRYALICRQCQSHNGMALREEFEYFAFRCCYCNFWNPARKQKPSAPKLEMDDKLLSPRRLSLQLNRLVENLTETDESEIGNFIHTYNSDSDMDIEEQSSATSNREDGNLDMTESQTGN